MSKPDRHGAVNNCATEVDVVLGLQSMPVGGVTEIVDKWDGVTTRNMRRTSAKLVVRLLLSIRTP